VQRVFSPRPPPARPAEEVRLRYILRVSRDKGIEAFVGKRVHEVLERLYQFSARGQVPSLERVLQRFRANWESGYDPERVRIVREGDEMADYLRVGERCLENAYRRLYPFDDETLGLEHPVEFPLDGDGAYAMRGVIDRVVRARDGALEIHDYKTGRWLPKQADLDRDASSRSTRSAPGGRFGRPARRLVCLRQNQVRSSRRTPEQLDAAREAARGTIDRIGAERVWEARPGALCAWCEYRPLCPAFAGAPVPAPEALPPDLEPPEDEIGQLSLW
jgi:putative RecB family exonuclease